MTSMNLLILLALWQAKSPVQALPNMIINQKLLANGDYGSPFITTETFTATSPAVLDGYILAGTHKLLRFAVARDNIGNADMELGDPLTSSFFGSRPSGGKWFLPGDRYHLWTQAGYKKWVQSRNLNLPISGTKNAVYLQDAVIRKDLLAVTRKHMVCFETEEPINPNNPAKLVAPADAPPWAFGIGGVWFGYSCSFQGQSAGWRDVYGAWMDGQWLPIDNVPPGTYILECIVNPDHDWPVLESNYKDNSAAITVTIP